MAVASDRCRRAAVRLLAIAALLSAGTLTGGAQGIGAASADISAADCEQLAKLPNAPISVETCKAMMGMAASMEAAAGDPRAQRPGDSALTCPQIFAELQAMADVGISDLNITKSDAVVKEGTALAQQQAGVLTGFMAESLALGAVMGAASAVMPNFVAAAIAAAWQARFVAIGVAAQAAQAPVNARMSEALQASSEELMDSMQASPRFARLGQLALAKECEAPAGAR